MCSAHKGTIIYLYSRFNVVNLHQRRNKKSFREMNLLKNRTFGLLALLCVLTVVPFLGLTDYHTKGEPREAIVAYTMLETGNWILPENNGGDMAYKPPFFHWCIAVVSAVAGEVNEFTSRLPSAVAMILMILAGYAFFARRRGRELALIAALVTLTAFEVHRAGFACRVDMVLTCCIVWALYRLFRWTESGCRGVPWLAVLLMGCGTLTKGPVGFILPCLVTGVYLLIRGYRFWRVCGQMTCFVLLSCVLPALWYVAAYRQGGDAFLDLVMEENLGRFLGKMSYESHENPPSYNVMTVLTGMLPYTLLALMALFSVRWSRLRTGFRGWWSRLVDAVRRMDDTRLYSLLSIVLIFVFYCIPKSKRSVYLLPIYPFLAYYLAELVLWLAGRSPRTLRIYGGVMAGLGILLTLVFGVVRMGLVSPELFQGKHAAENQAYLSALAGNAIGVGWLLVLLPLVAAVYWFWGVRRSVSPRTLFYRSLLVAVALFVSLDGVYQPAVLNVKSDRKMAGEVMAFVPDGPLYSYVDTEMMRFFVINFYSGNRVLLFEEEQPSEGYVLVGEKDAEVFLPRHEAEYRFEPVYVSSRRACDVRQIVTLYRFRRK